MLKEEAGSLANGYFVYLSDIKVTVNLTQIAFVEWNTVSDPKIDPAFITTVTLSGGGGFYLTKADTEILWKALQVFNQRQVQPGIALNQLYDLLFWQSYIPSQAQEAENSASEDANFKSTPLATATNPASSKAGTENPAHYPATRHTAPSTPLSTSHQPSSVRN